MKTYRQGFGAVVTAAGVLLSLPPLRMLIEQSMFWHMLIQMPLLILGGYLTFDAARAGGLFGGARRINVFGLTGFMLASLIMAYWMIPSSIDRALVMPGADACKIASLLLAGAALRDSFARSLPLVEIFFVGYTLPMVVWLGVYFASTDVRLCNAYSLDTQRASGIGLSVLGAGLCIAWLASLSLRQKSSRETTWRRRPTGGELSCGYHRAR